MPFSHLAMESLKCKLSKEQFTTALFPDVTGTPLEPFKTAYATRAVQAPTGVLSTLECVGLPRQQASLPSLELICGAMEQFPIFQEFLRKTKFEREMEGQELWGMIIHAVAQTYFPV